MNNYSDSEKHQIADELEAYLKDKQETAKAKGDEFSQNQLAALVGKSPAYVSYILSRQFDKKNQAENVILTDKIWKAFEDFIRVGQNVWDINNYNIIMSTLLDSKAHSYQYILDGPTGMGKTYTANLFKKRYPIGTFVIKCAPDMTMKQFMFELAREVGVSQENLKGSRYDLRVRACEKLLTMEHPIIVFDETEKTTQNARLQIIDTIQAMHDHKDLFMKCSFVVMGANNFYESLKSISSRKNPHAIPQFLSRFDVVYTEEYSIAEAKKICVQYYDIKDQDKIEEFSKQSTDYRQLARKVEKYINNKKLQAA